MRRLPTLLVSLALAGPVTAGPASDIDSDGFFDGQDNCLVVPQVPLGACDDDRDGYGNNCDGDLNNDGVVNGLDFSRPGPDNDFLDCFLAGSDPANIGCDINCDRLTAGLDFSVPGANNDFLDFFIGGVAPGPSGLPCAGTVPCP